MKKGNVLPNDEQKEICDRIRELRKESGYSQKFVAGCVGVDERTYRKWENGEIKKNESHKKEIVYFEIGHSSLVYLSELYGVSIDYILGNTHFKSVSGEAISNATGLSDESISALITAKRYNDKLDSEHNTILPRSTTVDGLNDILEDLRMAQKKASTNGESREGYNGGYSTSILSDIYFYLNAKTLRSDKQDTIQISNKEASYSIRISEIVEADAEYKLIRNLGYLRDRLEKK